MGNKYDQSRNAKDKFESPILDYMIQRQMANPEKPITKWELAAVFNKSERMIRRDLEKIANYYPLIATSDHEGYKVLLFDESMPADKLENIRDAYQHQLNELMSRVESLNARMQPLIAACTILDQTIQKKGE